MTKYLLVSEFPVFARTQNLRQLRVPNPAAECKALFSVNTSQSDEMQQKAALNSEWYGQARSQDFVQEGANLARAQGTPYQK